MTLLYVVLFLVLITSGISLMLGAQSTSDDTVKALSYIGSVCAILIVALTIFSWIF